MPELPEVLTIKKDLHKEILGKEVVDVVSVGGYKLNPSSEHFEKHIIGSKVVGVSNIAKLITVKFDSKFYIATHLNMTGRLLYNVKDPYVKIKVTFNSGDILNYSSVRMFGYFEVWDKTKINAYSNKYGKVALDKSLTKEEFADKISSKNTYIKNNLLNQQLISGIGNIYACDALYLSKIHPKTKPSSLNRKDLYSLFSNVRLLLNEGIKHRGSSIDRYTDLYGKKGTHQNHFRVYGKRNKEPCTNCSKPIIFEKIQGRGTFYCENCQIIDKKSLEKSLF